MKRAQEPAVLSPIRRWSVEAAKRIVLAGLGDARVRVYLFGSHARGTVDRLSDIDIALDPVEPLSVDLLVEIRSALEESTIPYFVDLVDLSQATPEFRARALADAVPWTS